MTSTYPYTFDSMSRLEYDESNLNQRNLQNVNNANYQLENYYPDCPISNAINFATQQPNVFYKGSHEGGIKGCEIETNNELKFSHISKPACKLNLTPRQFITIPYLGKGTGDPELELRLQHGENFVNKKTVNNMMELSFVDNENYPMIDSMKEYVSNSAYVIEDDAMSGWSRGGMSARDFARQNNN